MRKNQNLEFLDEKVTYVFRLFDFKFFLCLSFFSFSFLFAAAIDLLLGLLTVKKTSKKASSKCHRVVTENLLSFSYTQLLGILC